MRLCIHVTYVYECATSLCYPFVNIIHAYNMYYLLWSIFLYRWLEGLLNHNIIIKLTFGNGFKLNEKGLLNEINPVILPFWDYVNSCMFQYLPHHLKET